MGLTVRLEDEHGLEVAEALADDGTLARLLPSFDDPSSPLLRFIDRYGDTTFNRQQIPVFLDELRRFIHPRLREEKERSFIERLEKLARRCASEPHLYLKFYGD